MKLGVGYLKKRFLPILIMLLFFLVPVNVAHAETPIQNIVFGTTVDGYMTQDVQSLTYQMTLPKSGRIDIEMLSYFSTMFCQLTDAQGNHITYQYLSGSASQPQEWKEYANLEAGIYFIKLQGSGTGGNFKLKVNFQEAGTGDIEPNNDNTTAQTITLSSKTFKGFLSMYDKDDVYKLQLSKDQIIDFHYYTQIYSTGIDLTDENGIPIFAHGEVVETDENSVYAYQKLQTLKAGTYYLKIRLRGGELHSGGVYSFDIKAIPETTGWLQISTGEWVYYDAATKALKTGWFTYNGKKYYLNNEGIMQTGFSVVDGTTYYLGNDGAMRTGWAIVNNSWYYFGNTGAVKPGWLLYGGQWYFIGQQGQMSTGVTSDGSNYYFLDNNGHILTGWVYSKGEWYYYTSSGAARHGWLMYGGSWYYIDNTGWMTRGIKQIGGKYYYFSPDGIMRTGWQYVGNSWYYFNSNGAAQVDWFLYNGKWYCFDDDGTMMTGGWIIRGEEYYFNHSGAMETGWQFINGCWYYFNSNGGRKEGWFTYGGKTYFLHYQYGYMLTGYWSIDGINHYFGSDGAMIY